VGGPSPHALQENATTYDRVSAASQGMRALASTDPAELERAQQQCIRHGLARLAAALADRVALLSGSP